MVEPLSKDVLTTTTPIKEKSARSMQHSRSVQVLVALFAVYFCYAIFHIFSSNGGSLTQFVHSKLYIADQTSEEPLLNIPAASITDESVLDQSEEQSLSAADEAVYNDQSKNHEYSTCRDKDRYRELYSLTRADRKFYPIRVGHPSYNPNVIPHPTNDGSYIVVAQFEQYDQVEIQPMVEWLCVAKFRDDELRCTSATVKLPVDESIIGKCEDDLAWLNFRFGPRDARVFYGPETPYVIYGSQGRYTCLSQWSQDLRMLTHDLNIKWPETNSWFENVTELARPPPYGGFEKNFFFFWDFENKTYIHNDVAPTRVFAEIDTTGTVGEDLAPESTMDGKCLEEHLPHIDESSGVESLHQATNSLSITLCERSNPNCVPNDQNTYIMHLFQHKSFYESHASYDPYVVLFRRSFPFAFYAFGKKPFWITGREKFTEKTKSAEWIAEGKDYPEDQNEYFYMTSISWKGHGMRYHGYMDDVLLLNFGIEDSYSGTIDIKAEELLRDLALCEE